MEESRAREGAESVPVPGHPWVPLAFLVLVAALTGLALHAAGSMLLPAIAVLGSGLVVDRLVGGGNNAPGLHI